MNLDLSKTNNISFDQTHPYESTNVKSNQPSVCVTKEIDQTVADIYLNSIYDPVSEISINKNGNYNF